MPRNQGIWALVLKFTLLAVAPDADDDDLTDIGDAVSMAIVGHNLVAAQSECLTKVGTWSQSVRYCLMVDDDENEFAVAHLMDFGLWLIVVGPGTAIGFVGMTAVGLMVDLVMRLLGYVL